MHIDDYIELANSILEVAGKARDDMSRLVNDFEQKERTRPKETKVTQDAP